MKMLTDVKKVSTTMRALTNSGYQDSDHKGILPGFSPVWVNKQSRLNILTWCDVRKKFRITADTEKNNNIVQDIPHCSRPSSGVLSESFLPFSSFVTGL